MALRFLNCSIVLCIVFPQQSSHAPLCLGSGALAPEILMGRALCADSVLGVIMHSTLSSAANGESLAPPPSQSQHVHLVPPMMDEHQSFGHEADPPFFDAPDAGPLADVQ